MFDETTSEHYHRNCLTRGICIRATGKTSKSLWSHESGYFRGCSHILGLQPVFEVEDYWHAYNPHVHGWPPVVALVFGNSNRICRSYGAPLTNGLVNMIGGWPKHYAEKMAELANGSYKIILVDASSIKTFAKRCLKIADIEVDQAKQIIPHSLADGDLPLGTRCHHFVMGDSHAFSTLVESTTGAERINVLSLHRMVRDEKVHELMASNAKEWARKRLSYHARLELDINVGSIDLRYYWRNYGLPSETALAKYRSFLQRMADDCGISKMRLVAPLPVEPEGSRIPAMVMYKPSYAEEPVPYFGTQAEREELRKRWIGKLHETAKSLRCRASVLEFVPEEGKCISEYIEKPKSIHLAPLFHRGRAPLRWRETDA